jgi:hypothetical protein
VVPADGEESVGAFEQVVRAPLDLGDGLVEGERVGRDVAGVGDLLAAERFDVERRVVGP